MQFCGFAYRLSPLPKNIVLPEIVLLQKTFKTLKVCFMFRRNAGWPRDTLSPLEVVMKITCFSLLLAKDLFQLQK